MSIKVLCKPPRGWWKDVVDHSTSATFFHTPDWAEIITATYPEYKIATRGFILDDGARAIFPALAKSEHNLFFQWYESMYLGTYGGIVAERELTTSEWVDIFHYIPSLHMAHLHIIGTPLLSKALPDEYKPLPLSTHLLDLTPGYDVVYKRFSKSRKQSIKKAVQRGVSIDLAVTEDEYAEYFNVYQDSLRRWGETTLVSYPFQLFQEIFKKRSRAVRLWLARVSGQIVSGKMVFTHNNYQVYWLSATLENFFDYYPDSLLLAEILRDSCSSGITIFDFGASGGLKGVEKFKELFGAHRVPFYSYKWQSNRIYRIYQSLRTFLKG